MTALARGLAALGAIACAASVGLGAYASHGLAEADARRAGLAALFLFGHGLALLVLATPTATRLRLGALAALACGVLVFSGSLLGAVFAGTATALAPAGGVLMMLAWLTLGVDAFRQRA
ncbi:DUF423 domain-containing protein [Arenimonas sp.]|uniref:DUF423 domain-containing protein n=1 Tax=Arenimonas sp. TaxID=1872635 RepID=UPI0025BC0FAC|nr:DUF423 domain-containing protein [Arenimonas sp.]